MSAELLSNINDRYHMALHFHRESADLFWFLSLQGYATLHEFQLLEEGETQRKIKRYIFDIYGVPIVDNVATGTSLFSLLTQGQKRHELTSDVCWNAIKRAWEAYETWELETLQEYERIAHELFSQGDIVTFNFVSDIIKDVGEEVRNISNELSRLKTMDFDLPQIIGEQEDIRERYLKKMKEIYD